MGRADRRLGDFRFIRGKQASQMAGRALSSLVRCESVLGRGGDARSSRQSCEKLTSVIRLVRAELHLMEAALAGDDALAKALGHDVVAGWATFTEALQPTRDALAANPSGSAWGARFFVARDPPELVGWGGFKGPPKDGVVEVGFEIAEARRGRGLATAATRAMLAEAFADERVTAVIAHTLPERNASNRVLEKAGFRFEGEAQEDDEVVWRFSLTRPASGA
jgi:[ribosomal protein S5]-alanine N-acetyltransferase